MRTPALRVPVPFGRRHPTTTLVPPPPLYPLFFPSPAAEVDRPRKYGLSSNFTRPPPPPLPQSPPSRPFFLENKYSHVADTPVPTPPLLDPSHHPVLRAGRREGGGAPGFVAPPPHKGLCRAFYLLLSPPPSPRLPFARFPLAVLASLLLSRVFCPPASPNTENKTKKNNPPLHTLRAVLSRADPPPILSLSLFISLFYVPASCPPPKSVLHDSYFTPPSHPIPPPPSLLPLPFTLSPLPTPTPPPSYRFKRFLSGHNGAPPLIYFFHLHHTIYMPPHRCHYIVSLRLTTPTPHPSPIAYTHIPTARS